MTYVKTYLPTLKTYVVNLKHDAKDLSRDLQRLEVPGKLGSKTLCYPNSVATFQLLMSAGDIASNPGPAINMSKNKRMSNLNISAAICRSCEKPVRKNQKRVLCEVCMSLTHARCSGIASFNVKKVRTDTPLTWAYGQCLVSLLPFIGSLQYADDTTTYVRKN